jgi:hypothetical protein
LLILFVRDFCARPQDEYLSDDAPQQQQQGGQASHEDGQ